MSVVYDYQDFQIDEEAARSVRSRAQSAFEAQQYQTYSQMQMQQRPVTQLLPQTQEQTYSEPQKAHLASKIADLLIKESSDQSEKSNGKKTTPFVKEALPGENQTVSKNTYFLGFVKFSSMVYVALHLFVNVDVYEMWGQGSWYMVLISAIQLICTAYSYLLSSTADLDQLRSLFNYKVLYLILVGIVSVPVGLVTFIAFYAFQEADQIASYTVSSNLLQYSFATLFPFLTLVLFTNFLWSMRLYELDNSEIDFKPDYHFGPKQVSMSREQAASKKLSRDLTMQLLQKYLEEPSSAPVPDLQQSLSNEIQVRII